MRKKYNFRITVESLDPVEAGRRPRLPLNFDVKNHDNILAIVKRMRAGTHFDESTATSFAVGLKLLTEVLLENRDNPLFSELKPAIIEFMKKLKAQMSEHASQGVGVLARAKVNGFDQGQNAVQSEDVEGIVLDEEALAQQIQADEQGNAKAPETPEPQMEPLSLVPLDEPFVVGEDALAKAKAKAKAKAEPDDDASALAVEGAAVGGDADMTENEVRITTFFESTLPPIT